MNITSHLMGHGEVVITARQRSLHSYVIGQSGMGKSKALETWVVQDILARRGVGVIDPHGDLYLNLVAWLARRPELWEKTILVDPTDPVWSVGFNPLEGGDLASNERLALFLTDVCIKLWKLDVANTPRLVWLLTNAFLAIAHLGLSLLDLPQFLTNSQFREENLARASIPSVQQYFHNEFPTSEKGIHQWVTPVLNKLGVLLFDPDASLMFTGKSTLDFRQAMDEQMIVLINLPKGILGEGLSSLLAAFFVAHIQKAALARADTGDRPPFYLYLDEFQHYTTGNITDILSESRKYRLSLTLAHQYLGQLSLETKQAVLNTAGNLVCFRVGFDDARILAKEVFLTTQQPRQVEPRLYSRQAGFSVFPHLVNKTWDDLARELATLPERQFWYRRRGLHLPVKEVSFWFPNPPMTPALQKRIWELQDFSGNRFARRKSDLRSQVDDSRFENDLPLWSG